MADSMLKLVAVSRASGSWLCISRQSIGVALLCFAPIMTMAHDALPPGQSEIQIDGKHVRLMMSVPYGALKAYDTDQDGVVSASEVETLRQSLISHFLQAIRIYSLGKEVQWISVVPATAAHGRQADRDHSAIHFLARGQFPEIPEAVEVSQRLWAPGYLQNQIAVMEVKERKVLRREVRVLTQQEPMALFFPAKL